jgi:hypothetical protein
MQRSILAAAAVLILSSVGSAQQPETLYAQLSGISGNVLVDRGDGFVPATGTTELRPGNRILVSGKGGALLTYGPGCSVSLAADSLTTFTGEESCAVGTQGTTTNNSASLGFMGSLAGSLGATGVAIGSAVADDDDGPQS